MSDSTIPPAATGSSPELADGDPAAVDAMLAAAGLTVSADERAKLLEMYAMYKPGVAAMYALPETRYEAPALVFPAAPKLGEWGV
jgi:hypothetical protein